MNKKFEYVDDNPGAYFSMLAESLLDEDSYSSNGSDNRQVNFSNGSYAGKSEWSSNSKYGSSGKSYSDDWGNKKYQTTDKDKASDSYYKNNQKAQDDMKKNGNAVEEISKLSKDVADYTERKMETVQINGSSVQCKGVGDINNFKKRLLKHGYKEEKASGDWNSIFTNDKISNAKLGITNKGAVVLFYQNPQKESLTESFEYVDNNPGAYFGMLIEGFEDKEESLKEGIDKQLVQKLYSMWFSKEQAEWLAKNAKDYAESLAYGHTTTDDLIEAEEYVNSKMKKQEAIKESHNNIENIVTSVNKFPYSGKIVYMNEIRTPLSLSNDFNRINEFKVDVSKCKSLDELVHILKKYFAYDGSPINLTVIDDNNKYTKLSFKVFEDGETKIIIFHKNYQSNESLKESVSKSDLYSALEYMYGFNKKEANDWIKKASDKMKQSVVDGWKGNAKKSALTDSLKEDKFVSRDKMSKKDRKELDSQKRNTWGNTNPVTRVQPNKKAYDRKRDKKVVDESFDNDVNVLVNLLSDKYCDEDGIVTKDSYDSVYKYLGKKYSEKIRDTVMDNLVTEFGLPAERDKKIEDESLKESVLNESSDGWDESKLYDLSEILDEIYNLQYEVKNTVRGAYTNAHTYEELGYYVHNLGSNLMDIGDEIMEMEEEDEEDED